MEKKLIEPFTLAVPQQELNDLGRKLALTRWPDRETVGDWSQGAPIKKVRALCDYWRNRYDWRRCEATLNGWSQYRTWLDGLGIHFLHIRSPQADALPMIMTHGWPGSVIEFNKVIGPLTNPIAYGGDARDAFHLVLPSLPGYGFSDKPTAPGWNFERIARVWSTLMKRLGYDRYVAQGGDWGADIAAQIGTTRPRSLLAIHLNTLFFTAEREGRPLTRRTEGNGQGAIFQRLRVRLLQAAGHASTNGWLWLSGLSGSTGCLDL